MRSVLEVILQNLCRQCWVHLRRFSFHHPYHLATAHHLCSRQSRNLRRQHEIDLELCVGSNGLFASEQQAGATDIFRGPVAPIVLAEKTVLQRKVKLKPVGEKGRSNFPPPRELSFASKTSHLDLLRE